MDRGGPARMTRPAPSMALGADDATSSIEPAPKAFGRACSGGRPRHEPGRACRRREARGRSSRRSGRGRGTRSGLGARRPRRAAPNRAPQKAVRSSRRRFIRRRSDVAFLEVVRRSGRVARRLRAARPSGGSRRGARRTACRHSAGSAVPRRRGSRAEPTCTRRARRFGMRGSASGGRHGAWLRLAVGVPIVAAGRVARPASAAQPRLVERLVARRTAAEEAAEEHHARPP